MVVPHFIPPKLFGMKQLQQAVFMVRQRQLVKPHVLVRAGFNPS